MKIKAVLFDLDATLLQMDQDKFLKAYFGGVVKRVSQNGYDPQTFLKFFYAGIKDMVANNGEHTNEYVFWKRMKDGYGDGVRELEAIFDKFYNEEFDTYKDICEYTEKSRKVVLKVKKMGYIAALATSPLYPVVATKKRISWAGLTPEDFAFITTYENSSYAKPNPEYFKFVAESIGCKPCECLMVGNDTSDDFGAIESGMKLFLLTNCLINTQNIDINDLPHGDFEALEGYINNL